MKKLLIGAALVGALAVGGTGIAAAQSDGLDLDIWQAQYGDASGSVEVPPYSRNGPLVRHWDSTANPSVAIAQLRANEDWPFAPRGREASELWEVSLLDDLSPPQTGVP